jgi:hypothetical protein
MKPRNAYPSLEYEWSNLLLACKHCNEVKGSRFGGIIDPTTRDPEADLNFVYQSGVKVTPRTDARDVSDTIALLSAVYNGVGVDAEVKLRCAKLSEKVRQALVEFRLYIKHINEPGYSEIVRDEIDCASQFSAFKRQIICEDPKLAIAFADVLK